MAKAPKAKPAEVPRTLPDKVPVRVLAELSGLSERRVQQLAEDGTIPKPEERGEYAFEPCVKAIFAHLRELADGLPAKRAFDLARSAKAEADMRERERDEAFKRAIPFALVKIAWSAVILNLRSGIMGAKLPKKTKLDLIKRLRELKPFDYFKLGKTPDEEEENADE